MNGHAAIEYLKYTWHAKGRHGTHSPFVYNFIEQILLSSGPIGREYIVVYPELALRYENLLSRIAQHFGYKTITDTAKNTQNLAAGTTDMLLMSASSPERWAAMLDESVHLLGDKSIVVVSGIHKSEKHSSVWRALCKKEQVKMSLDLFGIGLLLFREEFKIKQHFILKY